MGSSGKGSSSSSSSSASSEPWRESYDTWIAEGKPVSEGNTASSSNGGSGAPGTTSSSQSSSGGTKTASSGAGATSSSDIDWGELLGDVGTFAKNLAIGGVVAGAPGAIGYSVYEALFGGDEEPEVANPNDRVGITPAQAESLLTSSGDDDEDEGNLGSSDVGGYAGGFW